MSKLIRRKPSPVISCGVYFVSCSVCNLGYIEQNTNIKSCVSAASDAVRLDYWEAQNTDIFL